MDYSCNPFDKYSKTWALLCAGTEEKFNAMTIGWGGFGTLWGEDVITVYVRPERYTWSFMEDSDYFTVSFYGKEHRRMLGIMGRVSGRDQDKVALTGLTPKVLENGITFEEATETFVCRKIYTQQLNKADFPDVSEKFYEEGAQAHYMFVGQIVDHL